MVEGTTTAQRRQRAALLSRAMIVRDGLLFCFGGASWARKRGPE